MCEMHIERRILAPDVSAPELHGVPGETHFERGITTEGGARGRISP